MTTDEEDIVIMIKMHVMNKDNNSQVAVT